MRLRLHLFWDEIVKNTRARRLQPFLRVCTPSKVECQWHSIIHWLAGNSRNGIHSIFLPAAVPNKLPDACGISSFPIATVICWMFVMKIEHWRLLSAHSEACARARVIHASRRIAAVKINFYKLFIVAVSIFYAFRSCMGSTCNRARMHTGCWRAKCAAAACPVWWINVSNIISQTTTLWFKSSKTVEIFKLRIAMQRARRSNNAIITVSYEMAAWNGYHSKWAPGRAGRNEGRAFY